MLDIDSRSVQLNTDVEDSDGDFEGVFGSEDEEADDDFADLVNEENIYEEYMSDPEYVNVGDVFLDTPENTDNEVAEFDRLTQHKTHRQDTSGNLYLGRIFNTGEEFQEAVVDYVLDKKFNVKFSRCESKKCEAKCVVKGCDWRIYCSVHTALNKWMIKTFNDVHNHPKSGEADILTSRRIAKLFAEDIRLNPSYSAKDMQKEIMKRHGLIVTRCKCFKARRIAMGLIFEGQEAQFERLWDYEAELLKSNPRTTTEIGYAKDDGGEKLFDRFYVCFEVLRETWKTCCRPIIGLDGCFLKWKLKGELLAAIGRDGDNRVYPIAWAIVRVENNDTWGWFVSKLKADLGLGLGDGVTIHSDKQKGLIRAIEEELPRCEHRMCARHIYANWKKQIKETSLKKHFWQAAYSYNHGEFSKHIDALRSENLAAYDALMASNPKHWSQAFFSGAAKCGDIHNNLNESYNSSIRKARLLPIIDMLEDIRRQTMMRISKRLGETSKCVTEFTPFAMGELEAAREKIGYCVVIASGHKRYEVLNHGMSYTVDLNAKTCPCRQWDVTGIPCNHALAVINQRREGLSDYVSDYFSKAKWVATYRQNINPVNGSLFWRKSGKKPIVVPKTRNMPGRPKKFKRKKDPHESPSKRGKITKHGRKMTCSQCRQVGHNAKTCKNEPVERIPVRGRGRPRKSTFDGETSTYPQPNKAKSNTEHTDPWNQQSSASSAAGGNNICDVGLSIPTQLSQTVKSTTMHRQRNHPPHTTTSLPSRIRMPPRAFKMPRQNKPK
ncbi:PREDICTED: uncharacterized protein LOC104808850 [Tarenaya hassleriana]|uniref:uncharacterized protein LOC104808850 n=1 Tax=Tarenaya hassleriana TaxID=28532 RepID=UPI00053CA691|nr:PREDICTED: uncharacterized protein LOC104808850 [Tarenaya hassleriana]